MYIIGLSGTTGSGKSEACRIFANLGFPIIDADAVYRDLLYPSSPLINKLSAEFGKAIVDENGGLNRAALADIVFSVDGRHTHLPRLNAITHTAILEETEKRITELEKNGYRYVIFDAPQLFESGFDKKCDTVVVVIANVEIRLQRIMERDGITEQKAMARINSQLSDKQLTSMADHTIINNGTRDELQESVAVVAKKIFNEVNKNE